MSISRLFEITYLLMEKGTVTAKSLAQQFEVSTRTIYRDIDVLSGAGIPVYTTKGKNGGIHLMEQFVLDRSLLSPKEQDEILFALQSLAATGGERAETLTRLQRLFCKDTGDWLYVDFSDWGNKEEGSRKFALLKTALLEKRAITFTYYSSYGITSRRTVVPGRLCFKSAAWYLQGYCLEKKDWRTFKICRMEELVLLEIVCPTPPTPPPALQEEPWGETPIEVTLRFGSKSGYLVYDQYPHEQIIKEPDGSFLVTTQYPPCQGVYQYLLSFGKDMEIISPPFFREAFLEGLKEIREIYEKSV